MIYSNVILLPTKRVIKYRDSCTKLVPLYFSLILGTRSDRLRGRYFSLVFGIPSVTNRGVPRFGINGGFPVIKDR